MAAGWCRWREGKKPYDSFRLRRRRTNSSASICAHFKQADEHAKFVPSCKHGERRDGLCDEQRGLVRPAISRRSPFWELPVLPEVPRFPRPLFLTKNTSNAVYFGKIRLLDAQL